MNSKKLKAKRQKIYVYIISSQHHWNKNWSFESVRATDRSTAILERNLCSNRTHRSKNNRASRVDTHTRHFYTLEQSNEVRKRSILSINSSHFIEFPSNTLIVIIILFFLCFVQFDRALKKKLKKKVFDFCFTLFSDGVWVVPLCYRSYCFSNHFIKIVSFFVAIIIIVFRWAWVVYIGSSLLTVGARF